MKNINNYLSILCTLISSLLTLPATGRQPETMPADSLEIMIGQMIMVGFHGKTADADTALLNDINKGYVGGVILYEKNISASKPWRGLKNLTFTMQKAASIPLWIAIDQEGGRINRLKIKYGFPPSVTAEYLGNIDNPDSTRYYADLTAATLAGLGINVNFAPVADLAANAANPIIAGKGRAYSADPSVVARHAVVVVGSHRNFRIVTSLKHFPGHGSSTDDTHMGMADVTAVWTPDELIPYQIMIQAGKVDAIMTAHIINGRLDSLELPATLSHAVINGLLRNELGYDGVVFSDDMHMRAISDHYGLKTAIKLSINAGVDVLLFSNNLAPEDESGARNIHLIIRSLINEGSVGEDRIRESYQRIIRLKNRYSLHVTPE
ncbi:MAG: glycoside hydrolase family 3 protein [Bacteroidetes bacterium]|nr:glycoside hydrolase family 3 protein [Bacteroidota bacterium]